MAAPSRGFSRSTAAFLIVSSMVGGGILSTSGYVALAVGSHPLMLLLWGLGGLLAACGALTMAEMSAALPRSGGEFVILSEAYGPRVGFLGGWVSLVMGFVLPVAATASSASAYLMAPWPDLGPIAARAVASVAILGFAIVHASGRSRTAALQGLVTGSTLAGLVALVVAGTISGWPNLASLVEVSTRHHLRLPEVFSSLILVSYCYTGWNGAAYVVGEMDDPQRELPRAVILGTLGVVLLYLGLNLVYALALPVEELRKIAEGGRDRIEQVTTLAVDRLWGPRWARGVSIGLGVVLLASLSALLATGPRVAWAMASEGRLPAVFGRRSDRDEAPAVATVSLGVMGLVVLWVGSFEQIVTAAGVALAISSIATIAAVYVLRARRPDLVRPFRVPGYPVVPAIYLAFTASSLGFVLADRSQWGASMAGVAGILVGLPIDLAMNRRKTPEGAA